MYSKACSSLNVMTFLYIVVILNHVIASINYFNFRIYITVKIFSFLSIEIHYVST